MFIQTRSAPWFIPCYFSLLKFRFCVDWTKKNRNTYLQQLDGTYDLLTPHYVAWNLGCWWDCTSASCGLPVANWWEGVGRGSASQGQSVSLWETVQVAIIPGWALSCHLQTSVVLLRVVFLENFSFASVAREFKRKLKNLRKGI